MTKPKWTSNGLAKTHGERIRQLHAESLGRKAIADALTQETDRRCTESIARSAMQMLGLAAETRHAPLDIVDVSEVDPADGDVPIEDLIAARIKASERKAKKSHAHRRTLELPAEPLGIMVFGDPHVDNDGCDWATLSEHVKLVQDTEGVLAACVGDMQDNWIGRLQRLYANSSMLASDGWRLSQWLLESMQWVALCAGNHDSWSNGPGVDPLAWISKQANVMAYAADEIRITLQWRGRPDLAPVVWVLRHDFAGRSWYHPTHGPHKEAMLDGRCHLLTAGHIHQWGQLTTEQRHERITHAVRVRGYKRNDCYAREKGFAEQTHGEAVLVVIDPAAAEPGRISVFWDLQRGCDYLTWLRGR